MAEDYTEVLNKIAKHVERIEDLVEEGGTGSGGRTSRRAGGYDVEDEEDSDAASRQEKTARSTADFQEAAAKASKVYRESIDKAAETLEGMLATAEGLDPALAKGARDLVEFLKDGSAKIGEMFDISNYYAKGADFISKNAGDIAEVARSKLMFPVFQQLAGETAGYFQEIQGKFGGQIGNITDTTNTAAANANLAFQKYLDAAANNAGEVYKVNGQAIGTLSKGYLRDYENFVQEIMNDSRNGLLLAQEAAKDGGEVISQELVLAGKAFGLRTDQLATFISRSVERTGKANTDLLRQSTAAAQAAGSAMGVHAKQLMPIMAEIMESTERFGNVGSAAAARISAQVLKLGIDFRQLDQVVGGFQGFESAASNVGKLTAAFGVNLDAMELMYQANEDQEQVLITLREAFEDAGIDMKNMSLAQKRLISDSLSGIGVENVDRIFGPLGEGLEAMNEKTQISTEQAILNATDGFKEAIKDLSAVLTDPLEQAAAAATAKMNAASGRIATEAMGQLSQQSGEAVQNLTDNLADKVKGPATVVLQALKSAVTEPLKEGDLTAKAIGEKLQTAVADLRILTGLGPSAQAAVAAAPVAPEVPATTPVPAAPTPAPQVPAANLTGTTTREMQVPGPAGSTRVIKIVLDENTAKAIRAYEVTGGTEREVPVKDLPGLTGGSVEGP